MSPWLPLCVAFVKMLWPEQIKVNLGGAVAAAALLSLPVKSSEHGSV